MKKKLFYFGMVNFFLGAMYLIEWGRSFLFFLSYIIKGKTGSDDPGRWWFGLHKNHPWIFILGGLLIIIGFLWIMKNRKKIIDWIENFFDGIE